MSGIASVMVALWERVRKKPLLAKGFWAVALVALLASCDRAWQDEHRNTEIVKEEKSAQTSLTEMCQQNSRIQSAFQLGLQGSSLSQRETIDRQQQSLNSLSGAAANCVVSLGKMNPVIREKILVITIPVGTMDVAGHIPAKMGGTLSPVVPQRYLTEVFIITNESEGRFQGIIHCDQDFEFVDTPIVPSEGQMMSSSNTPNMIDRQSYEISYNATAYDWNQSHPAYMRLISKKAYLSSCSFRKTE